MAQIDSTSESLFEKLRNRFNQISMGDEDGLTTNDPREARFFNFNYVQDEKNLGNITISIVNRQNLKVFYGQEIVDNMEESELNEWYRFLRELRRFAKSQIMTFDVRDITKTLNTNDLNFLVSKQKKSEVRESKVTWKRKGARSSGKLGDTRIEVLHDDIGNENPHNRLLKVQKIYLKNPNEERFLMPFNSVLAAKAMANHVSRGGTPYDQTGTMICDSVTEAKKLQKFCRYAKSHAPKNPEVLEAALKIKDRIKDGLKKLLRPKAFDSGLELLNEISSEVDIQDLNLYDDINKDFKPCIESATKAFFKMKSDKIKRLDELETLEKTISDPNFVLSLSNDPVSDQLIKNSKFNNTDALLSKALRTISDRVEDQDLIRNFASSMGNSIEISPEDPDDEWNSKKAIAAKLVTRYLRQMNAPREKTLIDNKITENVRSSNNKIIISSGKASITIGMDDARAINDLTQGEDYELQTIEGFNCNVTKLENSYRFNIGRASFVIDGPKFDEYTDNSLKFRPPINV